MNYESAKNDPEFAETTESIIPVLPLSLTLHVNAAKPAGERIIQLLSQSTTSRIVVVEGDGIDSAEEVVIWASTDKATNRKIKDLVGDSGRENGINRYHVTNSSLHLTITDLPPIAANRWKKIASYSLVIFALMLIGHFIFSYIPLKELASGAGAWYGTLDKNFEWIIVAGFLAQLVDGATSMGYGVTSAIALMSANVSPAAISGSIHTAEMFTSGASGYSHYKFGNVNKKLFKALLIPGIIGAVLGAILLVKLGDTHLRYLRPIMAAYTLFLGIRILFTAFKKLNTRKKFKRYSWLAGAGGFLDSFGGGGWGPIVTSTLITKGRTPRYVVGSVSLTEFFVTFASAFTFFTLIGVQHWQVILALVIGGLLAAPIAARLSGKLPKKASFILLGTIVILWSIRILVRAI
jgi:uncharacterized membrane protein YfcA